MNKNSGWGRSLLACKGPSELRDFHAVNRTAASMWIQLFDAVETPRNGEIPLRTWEVLALSSLDHDLPERREVTRGLLLVWSSTFDTLTKITTDDGMIDVNYADRR